MCIRPQNENKSFFKKLEEAGINWFLFLAGAGLGWLETRRAESLQPGVVSAIDSGQGALAFQDHGDLWESDESCGVSPPKTIANLQNVAYNYGGFPKNLKFTPPGPWLKSQEWLKSEILWGWTPVRSWIHVCLWALEKMPEAGAPNLIKHSSPEMPAEPCVVHWDRGGQGPISRHHSHDWLTSE